MWDGRATKVESVKSVISVKNATTEKESIMKGMLCWFYVRRVVMKCFVLTCFLFRRRTA